LILLCALRSSSRWSDCAILVALAPLRQLEVEDATLVEAQESLFFSDNVAILESRRLGDQGYTKEKIRRGEGGVIMGLVSSRRGNYRQARRSCRLHETSCRTYRVASLLEFCNGDQELTRHWGFLSLRCHDDWCCVKVVEGGMTGRWLRR
jgi:hypothetical protein